MGRGGVMEVLREQVRRATVRWIGERGIEDATPERLAEATLQRSRP